MRKAFWDGAAPPAADAALREAATKNWTEWEREIAIVEVDVRRWMKLSNKTPTDSATARSM